MSFPAQSDTQSLSFGIADYRIQVQCVMPPLIAEIGKFPYEIGVKFDISSFTPVYTKFGDFSRSMNPDLGRRGQEVVSAIPRSFSRSIEVVYV